LGGLGLLEKCVELGGNQTENQSRLGINCYKILCCVLGSRFGHRKFYII